MSFFDYSESTDYKEPRTAETVRELILIYAFEYLRDCLGKTKDVFEECYQLIKESCF